MPTTWTSVLYPQGCKFNKEYYEKNHMKIVKDNWDQYGLKSWKIIYFGDDSAYSVQALLEWADIGDFQKAAGGPEAKTVMGDVPNFCDKQPVIIAGEVALEG